MLKNLVKKFKSHSLNEDEQSPEEPASGNTAVPVGLPLTTSTAPASDCQTRRSMKKLPPLVPSLYSGCAPTIDKRARRPGGTGFPKHFNVGVSGNNSSGLKDDKDSGTESDEEFARTETNSTHSVPVSQTSDYYASQQSLSASCRSSHCGSPLLGGFSDQECNSLDSVGCESGIGLRTNEFNDFEMPTPMELPNHHYHTRQQFQRFLKQQTQISTKNGHLLSSTPYQYQYRIELSKGSGAAESTPTDDQTNNFVTPMIQHHHNNAAYNRRALKFPPTFNATTAFVDIKKMKAVAIPTKVSSPGAASSSSVDELEEIYGDCAKPKSESESVSKDASDCVDNCDRIRGRSSFTACTVTEKRKWSQVRSSSSSNVFSGCESVNQVQKIGGVNCESANINERQLLTAARKTPIKLLIPPRDLSSATNCNPAPPWSETTVNAGSNEDGTKLSPRKKCRPSLDEDVGEMAPASDISGRRSRPSLNFDKMREKMVKPSRKKQQHRSVNTAMKAKLRGWTPGYQLRSSRNECLFKPLDPSAILCPPQNAECNISSNNNSNNNNNTNTNIFDTK